MQVAEWDARFYPNVMAGLDPAIEAATVGNSLFWRASPLRRPILCVKAARTAWMAGSSPAKTW
jgi:hypothetical protein